MSETTTDDPSLMGIPPYNDPRFLQGVGLSEHRPQYPLTPLQEIEVSVHDHFQSAEPPRNDEVADFLANRYPKMDGGMTAILLAGLVIEGWRLIREEQDRRRRAQQLEAGGTYCSECGNPVDAEGKAGCTSFHRRP